MATFGMCTSPENAAAVRAAGFDYVEGSIQAMFQGLVDDAHWTGGDAIRASALPVPAANMLVPGDLKIVGPSVDLARIESYMANALGRAGASGTRTLVFGSGVARNVPDRFDRATARKQILAFLRLSVPLAERAGVTIVAEPLNRGECNVLNSVEEAMTYVREIDHPNFKCLVDSYHFWLEKEPLENLAAAMPWIAHVHVADEVGRVAPGVTGRNDYRSFFATLKQGGYDGRISVEGNVTAADYAPALAFLKREWSAA